MESNIEELLRNVVLPKSLSCRRVSFTYSPGGAGQIDITFVSQDAKFFFWSTIPKEVTHLFNHPTYHGRPAFVINGPTGAAVAGGALRHLPPPAGTQKSLREGWAGMIHPFRAEASTFTASFDLAAILSEGNGREIQTLLWAVLGLGEEWVAIHGYTTR